MYICRVMGNIYAERIALLRDAMRSKGWDAVIITGSDPHASEYPAPRWQQVKWLTGFTGEAGDVVVTLDHAGLWTDTRYFIQAREQLAGTGVVLHKTRVPEQVLIPEWILSQADGDADFTVAVDGLCFSVGEAEELEGVNVISVPDLLNMFRNDRPPVPATPVFQVQTGEDRADKISWLRSTVESRNCDGILLTSLDDIAWMLNVRASDIDYNPLVISYLLVTPDEVLWFAGKGQDDPGTEECFGALRDEGITILPYEEISLGIGDNVRRLWVDRGSLNIELDRIISARRIEVLYETSPVALRKAVKNPVEIEGMKNCHLRDGLAMEKFLFWLESRLEFGERVTEWEAAVKLGQLRAADDKYTGDSFETISAYGPGAALPHYITPRGNAPTIERHGLYLCDSGGHYLDGTTDITRTIPLGECTRSEMEDYTLVLKGHIDLAMAVFPEGTPGCRIDALAREPLWSRMKNFGHGTGHGVGYMLGCHEGPQDIRQNLNPTPLTAGMVCSDEPGIYLEGLYGVRHENLLLCVDAGSNDFGRWLRFEPLTLCHFDTSALIPELLTREEKDWLNAYNRKVYETFQPLLGEEMSGWLRDKTLPLE